MAEHLSSSGGILLWVNTYDSDRAAGMLKISVNDPDEIYFGAMIGQLQSYGKIVLANAGGVSQVRANSNFSHGFDT